jgi:hypothetical protein
MLSEAKLSNFWSIILDVDKQLFVNEKFLTATSDEGNNLFVMFFNFYVWIQKNCIHYLISQDIVISNKAFLLQLLVLIIWKVTIIIHNPCHNYLQRTQNWNHNKLTHICRCGFRNRTSFSLNIKYFPKQDCFLQLVQLCWLCWKYNMYSCSTHILDLDVL